MTMTKTFVAAGAGAVFDSLLLASPAAAQQELEPPETVESLRVALTESGYGGVVCADQPLSENQVEFTVPDGPGHGREWAYAQVVAPYEGDVTFSDVLPADPADTLSVLNLNNNRQQLPLKGVILCALEFDAGGVDSYEGGALNETNIYVAFNGETPVDLVPDGGYSGETENPVVETDVPARSHPTVGLFVGLAGGLAAAVGTVTLVNCRGMSQR